LKEGGAESVLQEVRRLVSKKEVDTETALVGAEAALEVGAWNDAGALGALATTLAPKNAEGQPTEHRGFAMEAHALYRMGQASAESGRGGLLTAATFHDAGTLYRRSREHGGDPFDMGYFEAEAYVMAGAHDRALEGIRVALEAQPDNWEGQLLQARILLALDRGSDAADLLALMKAREPAHPEVASLLLQATLKTGDRDRIRRVFLEVVKERPADGVLYGAFDEHFSNERPQTFVREVMAQAGRLHAPETDPLPLWYGALAEERDGRLREALASMDAYCAVRPTYASGAYVRARILVGLNRLDQAREAILRANALGGLATEQMVDGLRYVIGALVAADRFGPAADLQQVVVSLSIEERDEMDLAILLYHDGRRDQGITLLQRLSTREGVLGPAMQATVLNNLGLQLLGMGRKGEAKASLRRAVAADPESLDALENLGILLIDEGERGEGAGLLTRVLASDSRRDRSRYHLLRARYPSLLEAGAR
jgi:tetratricopeptide (TPR) repeat protein